MIADVLYEALEDIERYQRNYGDCYDNLRDRIEPVKAAMRDLMMYLDRPPEMDGDLLEHYRREYVVHVQDNHRLGTKPGTFSEFVAFMEEQERLCEERSDK